MPVMPGDVFFVESAGGGGYGPPAKRLASARASDLANGFVTRTTPRAKPRAAKRSRAKA